MKYKTLQVEKLNGVGIVWMNRPEVRNAFNETMIAELTAAFRSLDADREVRAVVLAGHGPAFCAGADLNWMKKTSDYSFAKNHEDALALANMLHVIDTLSKPTVARVHGAAFAGGVGLVAACDIAVAAQEAEFCISEVKLGLIPATISPYVIAAMGARMARRYLLTAERFQAAEAYRIGLVQELVLTEELDNTINSILGELVLAGPVALAECKTLIRSVAGEPISEALIASTAGRIATARASPEGREGIRSFMEKRSPSWVSALDTGKTRKAKRPAKARKA